VSDSEDGKTISLGEIKSGSKKAFETIVRRYMKDAYFIALGLVGNREDALDLSQEAFYRAYRHRKLLREQGKFFPWFYQILKNLCFSHLRRKKVRQTQSLEASAAEKKFAEDRDGFEPAAILQSNEIKDRLWKAIGRLDENHREVIILRHFRNLSYKQMAEMLYCNKGTVTSRLYYARKKLKEILDKEKGGRL
jgi:RNA polymerase sigma-70 factor (ECF subfamily)